MFKYFRKAFTKLSVLLLLALILTGTICYASTWEFKFPTYVTDNTGTTRTYYPVILGYHGQDLIDNGYILSSGNDTNMQIGTSSIDYMFSTTNVTCILENLPAYGKQTVDLYTGFSPQQSGFPIIIGDSGNITVSDAPAMEMGDNFTWTLTNVILNTDNGSNKNILYKNGVFDLRISDTEATKVILELPGATDNISPTSHNDLGGTWSNETNIYDDNIGTFGYTTASGAWSGYLVLSKTAILTDTISIYWLNSTNGDNFTVDVYYSGDWHNIFTGAEGVGTGWASYDVGNSQSVSDVRINVHDAVADANFVSIYEVYLNLMSIPTITLDGITSGLKSSLIISADTSNFEINITGTSNTTSQGNRSLINNSEDYIFMRNMSAVSIDSIELKVDGVAVATYEPTSMLSGATLNDETGTNDGTIIWGTNDNIIISYGAMVSSGLVEADVEGVASFDMPEVPLPDEWFSTGSKIANLPFYDSFASVSLSTGQPVKDIYFIGVIGLVIGTFLLVVMFTRSALLAVIASNIVLVGGAASTIVPLWLPFVVIIVQAAIMYLYKQFAY